MNHLSLKKRIFLRAYKSLFRAIYNVFSFFRKTDENKFVIALYRSKELEGNLEYVSDEIRKNISNAKIHLVIGENKMNLRLFKEIPMLSNARYLILDDYYLPIYLVQKKKDLKVIQLWHAAGAFKKFGYSTLGTKFGPGADYLKLVPIHSNYTHVYVSSKRVVPFYAEAFNMSENKIFPLGMPRVDFFREKSKCERIRTEILEKYPILDGKRIVKILVAPTYRANGNQGETTFNIIDSMVDISHLLHNNVQVIFKPHPYTKELDLNRLSKCPNILLASKHSINEWMVVADAFITDFSSSIFEFALLKKPMAHLIPDLDEYDKNRGLYQDINQLSDGTILTMNDQLADWINNRTPNEYFNSSRMIHYNFDDIQNITKKIVYHFTHK
ncbi:ribitolphosphotransferase [Agaribacter marinus]|uniref:CDP-glycerol glycerophosphotransferase family protein n=1 Tax=Virgibacillus salarius TaxID=447199 RepID=A0A941DUV7_9BACI|nr:CDP-glycerol glycerophosphotransferase family protein [Virgibacillus salarius]MBR7795792.1 CDP-glycerol glycerophosphotransferase family protein [Virgibacillus salarius]NAZ08505.1 ribitolphosphotransferase [Agaribacter marinus]